MERQRRGSGKNVADAERANVCMRTLRKMSKKEGLLGKTVLLLMLLLLITKTKDAEHLIEEPQDFATSVLQTGLLVVHDSF